jgi:CRISPR-associated endonuclease/helicase Cas3
VSEEDLPETQVAWREDVQWLRHAGQSDRAIGELLDDYPLKPHELLRDVTGRVFAALEVVAVPSPDLPVWMLEPDGAEVRQMTLGKLVEKDGRKPLVNLAGRTVILPPAAGGLREGLLDGSAEEADGAGKHDVADEWFADSERMIRRRRRGWDDEAAPAGMRLVRTVDTRPDADEEGAPEEAGTERRRRRWYVRPASADDDGSQTARGRVPLRAHHDDTAKVAERLADRLLPERLRPLLVLAARCHDLGKSRAVWQRSIGNADGHTPLAKSDQVGSLQGLSGYRHEFGSLLDAEAEEEFVKLSPE